jgi:hypothetical protein
MTSAKYIGMDVHKESISIAVLNSAAKVVMECVIETKASVILQFLNGLSETCTLRLRKEPQPTDLISAWFILIMFPFA